MNDAPDTYQQADPKAGRFATLAANLEMQALRLLPGKPVQSNLTAPLASFTFDDAPTSAVHAGAAILEKHGLCGTFYVNGGNAGSSFEGRQQFTDEDVRRLHATGHEIACHSWGHLRMRRLDLTYLVQDFDRNLYWARGLLGQDFDFDSFAWPYGAYDAETRAFCANRFVTSRGVYRGVNHDTMDFSNLVTVPLEKRRMNQAALAGRVEKALATNGWIIFFTHDVQPDCTEYGSPPEWLEEAVVTIKKAGIEVTTVAQAAKRIQSEL